LASLKAIAAVCNAICYILESAAEEDKAELGFSDMALSFQVFGSKDFTKKAINVGASVFLYRVLPNLTHRTPAGRTLPNGRRQRSRLPVDLHLLVTAWGDAADTQNKIVGWMLRTLEDYPSIPANVLNQLHPKTFQPDETVDLVINEMSGEELLHLWEVLSGEDTSYQISIPYVVRAVQLESRREQPEGEPVQVRSLGMGVLEGGPQE
jgi:hypothetical protein